MVRLALVVHEEGADIEPLLRRETILSDEMRYLLILPTGSRIRDEKGVQKGCTKKKEEEGRFWGARLMTLHWKCKAASCRCMQRPKCGLPHCGSQRCGIVHTRRVSAPEAGLCRRIEGLEAACK